MVLLVKSVLKVERLWKVEARYLCKRRSTRVQHAFEDIEHLKSLVKASIAFKLKTFLANILYGLAGLLNFL